MGGMILPGVVKSIQQVSITPAVFGDTDVAISPVNIAKSVVIPGTGIATYNGGTVFAMWRLKSSGVVTLNCGGSGVNNTYYATIIEYY